MHRFAMVALAILVPCARPVAQTLPSERERLMRSLETACAGLSDDRQWAEADACRRAWFTDNEEAVWRLNLNPHSPQPQPPS